MMSNLEIPVLNLLPFFGLYGLITSVWVFLGFDGAFLEDFLDVRLGVRFFVPEVFDATGFFRVFDFFLAGFLSTILSVLSSVTIWCAWSCELTQHLVHQDCQACVGTATQD